MGHHSNIRPVSDEMSVQGFGSSNGQIDPKINRKFPPSSLSQNVKDIKAGKYSRAASATQRRRVSRQDHTDLKIKGKESSFYNKRPQTAAQMFIKYRKSPTVCEYFE